MRISSSLLKFLQGRRRKELRLGEQVIRGKNTNPSFVLNDVWVRKTLIHPWVLLMVVKSRRENDEVSKEMLSKIFQTHVFVLAITWSFLIQIE